MCPSSRPDVRCSYHNPHLHNQAGAIAAVEEYWDDPVMMKLGDSMSFLHCSLDLPLDDDGENCSLHCSSSLSPSKTLVSIIHTRTYIARSETKSGKEKDTPTTFLMKKWKKTQRHRVKPQIWTFLCVEFALSLSMSCSVSVIVVSSSSSAKKQRCLQKAQTTGNNPPHVSLLFFVFNIYF